jgi:hypothetical protein
VSAAPEGREKLRGGQEQVLSVSQPPRRAPACNPSSSARWALLYTLPGKPKGDVQRSPLQQALAASYDVFYK